LAALYPGQKVKCTIWESEYVNLKDLAAMMVALFGKGSYQIVPFPPERKAIDIGDYYSDFTKIRSALGWAPRVSLKEGLKKCLEYYALNGKHYWEPAVSG
jgi:dTDP-glucose 4,6-dehydratase/UDP-glucose 4-epimerase